VTSTPKDEQARVGRIWTNAVWLGAIPLLLNVVSVVSAGFIARVLGTEAFGRFSMGSALVALTMPIADCGLRALAVRQLARAGSGANRALCDLLSLRLLLAITATIVACGVASLVSPASGLRPVILVTALTIVPVALAGTLSDGLMARDQARAISGSIFWSGALLTVASVLAAAHTRSATGLALAYVVGPVVNMTLLARQSRRVHGPIVLRWRPRHWRVLLRRSLPFFRIGVLSAASARLDTVIVGGLFGHATAGVYAAATSLADRLYILVDSVASAILPALSRLRAEPKRVEEMLGRVMYPLLTILTAGTIMSMAASTAVVTVIFGPAYASGGPVLAIGLLLLPVLAVDSMLAEGFLALRRDTFVAVTGVRGQVLNLLLMPVLPLLLGIPGARLSRVIGFSVSAIPRFRSSRVLFDGLWNRTQVRRFLISVLCATPVPCVLLLAHFDAPVAMAVAVSSFLVWCVATASLSGGMPMVRELVAQRNTPAAPIALPVRRHRATGRRPRRVLPSAASRVSVVIPCYNAEEFIADTLESILAQTRPPDEIIVADDCSTDRSREVVARYPTVRLLTQAKNSGCASARNLAIGAATGDLIAIIDADDLWFPDHLETAVGLLEDFPECGFVFSGIETFGGLVEARIPDMPAEVPLMILDRLLHGNMIHQPTVVFRRALYDQCGGFDATLRYCEDYDLWLQFASRSQGIFTGAVTAGYRIHRGQLNQHFPQMFAGTWYARFKLLESARASGLAIADHLQTMLGEIWVSGLYTAWAVRSRESLDYMLTLSDRFPEQKAAARQWRGRRPVWYALVIADRITGFMPGALRRALRPKWGARVAGRPAI